MAEWTEPGVEETIELLEWAYQHRDRLERLGQQAARDLGALTWRRAAEQFHRLLIGASNARCAAPASPLAA